MKPLLTFLTLFLMLGGVAGAEITLYCKFKNGGGWQDPDRKEVILGEGDVEDEYLKIDFEKEKIISAPNYEGFWKTSVIFQPTSVDWHGSKKGVYSYSAKLDRETGKLWIIRNQFKTKYTIREAWEYNYTCSKAKMKF